MTDAKSIGSVRKYTIFIAINILIESVRRDFLRGSGDRAGGCPWCLYSLATRMNAFDCGIAVYATKGWKDWGERRGLNPRPSVPQTDALPAELRSPQVDSQQSNIFLNALLPFGRGTRVLPERN